jgi:hypothetical protein
MGWDAVTASFTSSIVASSPPCASNQKATASVDALCTAATSLEFHMASIPLDLQKRCEQRWAARFSRPVAPKHRMDSQDQQLAAPGKADAEAALAEMSKPELPGSRPDPDLAAA